MSETPAEAGRAPLLGEHNEQVYIGALGLSKDNLTDLKEHGVI
jgi:formyl-CoA transferase